MTDQIPLNNLMDPVDYDNAPQRIWIAVSYTLTLTQIGQNAEIVQKNI
jgi:hypothetical protein